MVTSVIFFYFLIFSNFSFFRFLPCNSHHIRENNGAERQQRPSETTTNVETNTTSTATSTEATNTTSTASNTDLTSLPFNIFGSQFTIADFANLVPNPNALNRVRSSLQAYLNDEVFEGQPITDDVISGTINEVIHRLEPILRLVSQYDSPDYDTRASLENLLRNMLPICINLIREDNSQQFGVRLLRLLGQFVSRIFRILIVGMGMLNARVYAMELLNSALQQTIPNASPGLVDLFLPVINNHLSQANRDSDGIQEFLVIRRPAPDGMVASAEGEREPSVSIYLKTILDYIGLFYP